MHSNFDRDLPQSYYLPKPLDMKNLSYLSENMPLRFEPITSTTEFIKYLRNCYWSANQFENILPYLIKNSTSFELSLALSDAIPIAKRHTNRLIQIFDSMQERVKGSKCDILQHYFAELQVVAENFPSGYSLDNAIILQCQKIMSYDITVLSGLVETVNNHSETAINHYLAAAISEEKDAHGILTEIAIQSIYLNQAV